jgi:hypothetical protein
MDINQAERFKDAVKGYLKDEITLEELKKEFRALDTNFAFELIDVTQKGEVLLSPIERI